MRVVGIIIVLLSLPSFVFLLRTYPYHRRWAYFGIGIFPFIIGALNLDAAFISWGAWTGYATGFVVSVLDTLVLAVLITARKFRLNVRFLLILAFYFFSVFISVFQSDLWMSSSFYVFQLIRVVLVFLAVSTFANDYKSVRWLSFGLAIGAIYQCIVTIEQKLSGVVQAFGTMGHQNLLGLMLHFVTLPLLALIFAGERSKIIRCGVLAALLSVALGASRGSLAFVTIGLIVVIVLSLVRAATARKWKLIGLGVLAAGLMVPIALSSLSERFGEAEMYAGPDGEREAFERAARAMWLDNPMGVGANQYSLTANIGGYYERAGVAWNWSNRSTKVHNMYLLAGAETGWIGAFAFSLLIVWPIVTGLLFLLTNRADPRGDIVLGNVAAFIALALHGFYEWVFFVVHAQYLFAISLGVVASNVRRSAVRRRAVGRGSEQVRPAKVPYGPVARKSHPLTVNLPSGHKT
jgi:O-antigen ligase